MTHHDADLVALLLGHGDGTLAPAVALPVGGYPRSIDAGDLDQDGLVDLAVACNAGSLLVGHALELLFSAGDGTFGSAQAFAQDPRDTHIADLDVDGLPDLVRTEGTGIHASLGQGEGAFGPP